MSIVTKQERSFLYKGAYFRIESRVSSGFREGVTAQPWEADAIAHEIFGILSGKVLPLNSEAMMRAALGVCAGIGNENKAIVMYKSDTMEDDDWVGLYLSDVEEFEKSGENFFSSDIEAQLWIGD